jgi:hypothetical protein
MQASEKTGTGRFLNTQQQNYTHTEPANGAQKWVLILLSYMRIFVL